MFPFKPTAAIFSLLIALSSRVNAAAIEPTTSPDLTPRALGINCRGSFFCGAGAIDALTKLAFSNTGGCSAGPGQHLYCDGNFCIFNQGTKEKLSPQAAQFALISLKAHGCKGCGSVPVTFPVNNNPSNGIITVNYVSNTRGCSGICNRIC